MSQVDRLNTPEAAAKRERNRRTEAERRRELLEDRTPARHKPVNCNEFTHERRAVFLFMLSETGQRRRSANLAGVKMGAVYYRTNPNSPGYDPEFAELVQEADEIYNESVDGEIARRGVEGWKEPVFGGKDKDRIVGYVRKYSDQLLLRHAQSRMAKYRDKVTVTQESTGTGGGQMTERLANLNHEQRKLLRAYVESLEPKGDDVVDAEFTDVTPADAALEAALEDI